MARGWESKSVESQKADAGAASDRGRSLTPQERQRHLQLRDRQLSRQLVVKELATTGSAVRRTALEQALAFLDAEIEKLSVV